MKSDVKIEDNRLEMTRVFNAPRERVFAAWKQADLMRQWWGCRATTKVESTADFRVGGSFSNKMQIEGVGEMTFTGAYDEIVEPEKITYHAAFGDMNARVTVEFIDQGSQTKLILTQEGFPAPSFCEIVSEGLNDAFDKLDQLLADQVGKSFGAEHAVQPSVQ